jgi:hypothetical protein
MKNLLYTVAFNKNREIVTANDAVKGEHYSCTVCDSKLILRKSGKTGPGSKRPHFAHKVLTNNCTPETALHYAFKNLLFQKLKDHIESTAPINFSWECDLCFDNHSGNLIKKATNVRLEHYMNVCRPDLAMIDKEGKVYCVIEIVVTHKPEESVLNFYEREGIICLQISLTSDEDIYKLEEKLSSPTKVNTCLNPKCKVCGKHMFNRIMFIIDGSCWKCESDMKIAAVKIPGSSMGPDKFTNEEIETARSKGAILQVHYSKTTRSKYLANTCSKCGSFAGNHYLFTEFIAPACYNEIGAESFPVGFFCMNCEENRQLN